MLRLAVMDANTSGRRWSMGIMLHRAASCWRATTINTRTAPAKSTTVYRFDTCNFWSHKRIDIGPYADGIRRCVHQGEPAAKCGRIKEIHSKDLVVP